MRFYFDLAVGSFVSVRGSLSPLKKVFFKRGDSCRIEVEFFRNGVAVDPEDLSGHHFTLKNQVGGILLALADIWTWEEGIWHADFNTNTEALLEWLEDTKIKNALAEFTFSSPETGTVSTRLLTAMVENDLWRGNEISPTPLPTPDDDWVAHGHVQDLSAENKKRARSNIEAQAKAIILPGAEPVISGEYFWHQGTSGVPDSVLLPVFPPQEGMEWQFSTDGSDTAPEAGVWVTVYGETTDMTTSAISFEDGVFVSFSNRAYTPTVPLEGEWSNGGHVTHRFLEAEPGQLAKGIDGSWWRCVGFTLWEKVVRAEDAFSTAEVVRKASTDTLADADELSFAKATGGLKKISWSGIKTALKAWLDAGKTFAGQWIFTTSPRSSGTPDSGLSLLTRDQIDARLGRCAVLAADVEIVEETTPQELLVLAVEANSSHAFQIVMEVSEEANPRNQNFTIVGPAGTTVMAQLQATSSGSPAAYHYGNTGGASNLLASSSSGGIVTLWGIIKTAGTAGNIVLRGRQVSSSATPMIVRAGATMILYPK